MKSKWIDFWQRLSWLKKIGLILLLILDLVYTVWTIRDIWRRSAASLPGNRWQWTLLACIDIIGPTLYWLQIRKRTIE